MIFWEKSQKKIGKKHKSVRNMTERTKPQLFEEFVGVVSDIKIEPTKMEGQDDGEQYHLYLKPSDKEIKGQTGFIHEWVRIPAKATDSSVPEGSVLDKYLQQIEILFNEAKAKSGHIEEMQLLVGKSFLFKKVKHGKSFEGHEAKPYWTPVALK